MKVIQATEIRISKISYLSAIQETATTDIFFNQEISGIPNSDPTVSIRENIKHNVN